MAAAPSNNTPSAEKPNGATSPPGALSSFLKTVGEYKEVAAIIAFSMGGIFWAFAYFATKQQLKEVQCIINANMTFIQGRMDSTSLSQLMLDNFKEAAALDKASLTVDEMLKRNQLKVAATDIAGKLADANKASVQAMNKLQSGDCMAN